VVDEGDRLFDHSCGNRGVGDPGGEGLLGQVGREELGVFQLVLLMFRNGAVIILTGLLQLAAAGSFTNGTRLT
jgi:hypothetical protein